MVLRDMVRLMSLLTVAVFVAAALELSYLVQRDECLFCSGLYILK